MLTYLIIILMSSTVILLPCGSKIISDEFLFEHTNIYRLIDPAKIILKLE